MRQPRAPLGDISQTKPIRVLKVRDGKKMKDIRTRLHKTGRANRSVTLRSAPSGFTLFLSLLIGFLLCLDATAGPETHAGLACLFADRDASRAVELAQKGYLTLALCRDDETLGRMRDSASKSGLLGQMIFPLQGSPEAIPLADNTVDWLVLDELSENELKPAVRAEILRVLSPGHGQALLRGSTIHAPALDESVDWTHRLHRPDNNPVSTDPGFRGDPVLQYIAPPLHSPFMGAMLTTAGIRIEASDWVFKKEGRDSLIGKLIGRQAHNGLILWIRDLPEGIESDMPLMAAVDGRIYIADGDAPSVRMLDASTGQDAGRLAVSDDASSRVYWIAVERDCMTVLLGPGRPARKPFARMIGGDTAARRLAMGEGGAVLARFGLPDGRLLWRHEEGAPIDYRAAAVRDGVTYFFSHEKRLAALDPEGRMLWENADPEVLDAMRKAPRIRNFNVEALSSLIVGPEGHLLLAYREGERQFVFSSKTGQRLWEPQLQRGLQGDKPKWYFVGNRLHGDRIYDATTGQALWDVEILGAGCGLVVYSPGMKTGLNHVALGFKSPCGVGALPATGLLHFKANHCICWPYMRGAAAFATADKIFAQAEKSPSHPLVSQTKTPSAALAPEWPEYRGGPRRRGAVSHAAPSKPVLLWKSALKHPFAMEKAYNRLGFGWSDMPTPPIAGASFAWYGASDGAIRCVRLSDGAPTWTYWTGGSILTAPSIHEGRLFAASFDGWVYCLDASSGDLLWKWRAAPADRWVPVFGKPVSAWPVVAVQFHEDILYGVAGHWDANGAVVFALDAATGRVRWTHWSRSSGLTDPADSDDASVYTASGYLAVSGDRLAIPKSISPIPFVFDRHSGQPMEPAAEMATLIRKRRWQLGARTSAPGVDLIPMDENRILVGGVPLFNPPNHREHHNARFVAYALDECGGVNVKPFPDALIPNSFPAPALDGEDMLIVGGVGRKTARVNYPTLGVSLWRTADLLDPAARSPLARRGAEASEVMAPPAAGRKAKGAPDALDRAGSPSVELDFDRAVWKKLDIDVSAVALGPDAAYLVVGEQAPGGVAYNKHAGFVGWKLVALNRTNGSERWSVALPGEPVFNGIAAAEGKFLLTLRDGSLIAVGKK